MNPPDDSLLCPITLELFRDPVLAQDGHTYERPAIIEWIQKNGTSPITGQHLSLEHLYPNYAIKKAVDHFETSSKKKNYQYILDIDVKKRAGRPLFQTFGKTIYHAQWLATNEQRPEIILLKIDGARAKKEASFYVDLSRHPHIIRTYGFVHERNDDDDDNNENNTIMLLQEYAHMGSLYDLLQERKKAPDEKILVEIFLQIIDAMSFLAFNNVVHGDLACRNVLVFRFDENNPKNIIVKVTDFGLSRHSKLYSLTPGAAKTTLNIIPIRYAAPEILVINVTPDDYTEKSDIYSMGILMWEAYSRGAIPWTKIESDNEVIRRVTNGELLQKPSNCSELYWSIMCKTWSKSPKDRPAFANLKRLLMEQYYHTSAASSDTGRFSIVIHSYVE
jgi:serine/threonine protein kinase